MGLYRYGVENVKLGDKAWKGVTSINVNPTGGDAKRIYADDDQYGVLYGRTNYEGTVNCYDYPEDVLKLPKDQTPQKLEWDALKSKADGSMGGGTEHHFIYGVTFKPSSMDFETITDDVDAQEYSFDFTATGQLDVEPEDGDGDGG